MKTKTKKAVTLTIDEAIIEKAKAAAVKQRRSLSGYIEYLISIAAVFIGLMFGCTGKKEYVYSGKFPTCYKIETQPVTWTYTGELPDGLTHLYMTGESLEWVYSGDIPKSVDYIPTQRNTLEPISQIASTVYLPKIPTAK